jgi:hypothetical protein
MRRWIGLGVAVVSALYFTRAVYRYWPQIGALRWTATVATALVAAVLVQTVVVVFDGLIWAWLLRRLGVAAHSRQGLAVFGSAQFAKYLPGNFGQHISRVVLAREWGWHTGRVVLSLLLENCFAIGSGALIAGAGAFLDATTAGRNTPRLVAVLGLVTFVSMVAALALRRVLLRPPGFLGRWLEEPVELRFSALIGYLSSHMASYVGMAVALGVLFWSVSGSWPRDPSTLLLGVAVGWLSGFLVPGAPAGLGVREAALVTILGPRLGTGVVVASAVLWRLSQTASDVVALSLGIVLGVRRKGDTGAAPKTGRV